MDEPLGFSSEQTIATNPSPKKKPNLRKAIIILVAVVLIGAVGASVSAFLRKPSRFTRVGDVVKFGAYEQDNDITNGKEAIEWIVLDKQDGRLFVISKYVLDAHRYNDEVGDTTWAECSCREWLNTTFLDYAFSSDEQQKIILSDVKSDSNPIYAVEGGKDTQDKLFLLSIDEIDLLGGIEKRVTFGTEYAKANGLWPNTYYATWWSRTPGSTSEFVCAAMDGETFEKAGANAYFPTIGVRPAMWISIAGDTSPAAAQTAITQPVLKAADPNTVDYSGGWSTQWLCSFDTDDEVMNMLISIDRTEYGTAGSSLKAIKSAVYMLKLSENTPQITQKVDEYLSKMNATQKDYFSFQWHNSYDEAVNMLETPEEYSGRLLDLGEESFVISDYTFENLQELNKSVLTAIYDCGVCDVWKNDDNVYR